MPSGENYAFQQRRFERSAFRALFLGLSARAFGSDAPWVEIHSPHFSVATDAGEKRGRDVAVRFEQMRAVFGVSFPGVKVNTPVPLQIIAFRNTKELRQVSPMFHGKPTQLSGLFQSGQDRCFIMLDMSVENPWQVVFHEYAHQLMNGTLTAEVDPWFEEGFAEYFSTIEVDGREARVGKIREEEYQVLEQMGWMKIADLFKVQHNTATYNETGDHRTVFYAESGMLMHFLYDTKLIVQAGQYFDLVRERHVPVEEAIQQAFGMSASQFDKTLRAYESSGKFKYLPIPTPPGINGATYSIAPMNTLDVAAMLADVHLHSVDYQEKAAEEFEGILKIDPNNVAALRGLGFSYLIRQDFDKAGDYFSRAAEHATNDPRVYYYSAMLLQREGGLAAREKDKLEVAQRHLESAIKLDPDFADAYNLLAFLYRTDNKKELAIATMTKAVELNPRNEGYRFNLAQMYLQYQNFDSAEVVLESLKDSGDPQISTHANEQLAQIETFKKQAEEQKRQSEEIKEQMAQPVSPGESEPALSAGAAKFLKGKLKSVDCSATPSATLTVVAGTRTWKLHAANSEHLIVIGADKLACDWTNQNVAVNYRETGDGTGEVISLEVQ